MLQLPSHIATFKGYTYRPLRWGHLNTYEDDEELLFGSDVIDYEGDEEGEDEDEVELYRFHS